MSEYTKISCPLNTIEKSTSRKFSKYREIMFEVLNMNVTPIEQLLKERGPKKQWVAEKVGISRGTLPLICSGKSEPTLLAALKLVRLFSVSVEELWSYLIEEESQPGK